MAARAMPIPIRAPALTLLLAVSATAQIDDLATNEEGSELYFSTVQWSGLLDTTKDGRIYKLTSAGIQMIAERPRLPPPLCTRTPTVRLTDYFILSRPEVSRDGSVLLFVGLADCSCSDLCGAATFVQTTITGLPGGEKRISGVGRLSGNGRYFLSLFDGSFGMSPVRIVDLETGETATPTPDVRASWAVALGYDRGAGRVIADNGTAVLSDGFLYILRGANATQVSPPVYSPGEAVIDAAGEFVVYSGQPYSDTTGRQRVIRAYRIADGRDELLSGEGESRAPQLSADGRRVLYLSTVSGSKQVWLVNSDGSGRRQLTEEGAGVSAAVMSDDGQTVWYSSASGQMYRISLIDGSTWQAPVSFVNGFGNTLVPGSVLTIRGAGFADRSIAGGVYPLPGLIAGVRVRIDGAEMPLLYVSPTEIAGQVPWGTASSADLSRFASVDIEVAFSPSFASTSNLRVVSLPLDGAFVTGAKYANTGASWTLAAHENWDAIITPSNPAYPGEVIHLYATGLGPVQSPPETGTPSPPPPDSLTVRPITCTVSGVGQQLVPRVPAPVLYSGLIPALIGYYQIDLGLPDNSFAPAVSIECKVAGESRSLTGLVPAR